MRLCPPTLTLGWPDGHPFRLEAEGAAFCLPLDPRRLHGSGLKGGPLAHRSPRRRIAGLPPSGPPQARAPAGLRLPPIAPAPRRGPSSLPRRHQAAG